MKYQKIHPQPAWQEQPVCHKDGYWFGFVNNWLADYVYPPDDMKNAVPWQDSEGIWYWKMEFCVAHEKYEFL